MEPSSSQLEDASQHNSIELRKLEIEQRKLEVEIEKLGIERRKLPWTLASTIVPILAVLGTIFYSVWAQHKQEEMQFQLKAAEIMFNSPDAYQAEARAHMLKSIFTSQLPRDFSSKLYPDSTGYVNTDAVKGKKELLLILSKNLNDNNEIIGLWKKAFPDDTWVDTLVVNK